MLKYSIILRAYNAAKQVSRSIESVIRQSYPNWELIVVNDGSTDDTGEICRRYARKDQRIKVIHQENKGCLLATQTGVNNASGDYVCLIDADDWYDKTYIEKVNAILENHKVDMVVANYNIISEDEPLKQFQLVEEDCMTDAKSAMKKFLETTNYALWNKFVARERIGYTEEEQRHYDTYGKTTNFGDDLYLLMPVLCRCENVYFMSECLYNYTMDGQSISHKTVEEHCKELVIRNRLMEFTYDVIQKRQCMDEEVKKLIQIDTVVIAMPNIVPILKSRNFDKKVLGELKRNRFYREIVKKTEFSVIKNRLGFKKALVFRVFHRIIDFPLF